MGLPHPSRTIEIPASLLVGEERTLKGSYMGSAVPRRDIPRTIALYQAGLLPIDKLMSRKVPLADINAAFDALAGGDMARQLIAFPE